MGGFDFYEKNHSVTKLTGYLWIKIIISLSEH